MGRIKVESDEYWHELRRDHIGGSEISALFGEHPQITHWDLWHRKAGNLNEPNLDANERIVWGTLIEPAIAMGLGKLHGMQVRKVHTYWTSDMTPGMGASLDYETINDDRGAGVVECKTVDRLIFKNWPENADGAPQPPLHYQLQAQHQMAVSGRSWGVLACLIGGNEMRVYHYTRDDDVIAMLRREVTAFWKSIRDGNEPKPDFERDAARVSELRKESEKGRVADLTRDNRILDVVSSMETSRHLSNRWGQGAEAAKAEILHKIGDAEFARLPDGRVIEAPTRHRKAFTVEATSFRAIQIKEAGKSKVANNVISHMPSVF